MTNTRWKALVAALAACVIATGADKPPKEKKAEGVRKTLSRALKTIQAEQWESARHVADLEKEVQALRADVRSLLTELHALRGAQEPPLAVVEPLPAPSGAGVIVVPPEAIEPTEGPKRRATEPAVFRLPNGNDEGGDLLMVVSPEGDRLVLSDSKTGMTRPLKLSGDKAHPHQVRPANEDNSALIALAIEGPKITRLAVLSFGEGRGGSHSGYDWYPIDLREPVESAVPVVRNFSTATYFLGHRVYGFSRPAQRWDVLELPRGASPTHTFSNDGPTIENDGHLYTFVETTGKWRDLDVRAILDGSKPKGDQ